MANATNLQRKKSCEARLPQPDVGIRILSSPLLFSEIAFYGVLDRPNRFKAQKHYFSGVKS